MKNLHVGVTHFSLQMLYAMLLSLTCALCSGPLLFQNRRMKSGIPVTFSMLPLISSPFSGYASILQYPQKLSSFQWAFCQRVSRCSFEITVLNRQGRGSSFLFQGEEIRLSGHGISIEQLLVLGVLLDMFMFLSHPLNPSVRCEHF